MPVQPDAVAPVPAGGMISLAGPAIGPSLAGSAVTVPRERLPWTYLVSPIRLRCYRGQILPCLAKASHAPGLNGNARQPGRGEGFIAALVADGWHQVPHGIECVAFGETRTAAMCGRAIESTYLTHHRGLLHRRPASYYTDAWHRPRVIGPLTRWSFDEDGWVDFLGRCLKLVWDKPLDEIQIELAVEPVIRRLRTSLGRDTIPCKQAVGACLTHLPAEHVPADLREMYDAHHEALQPEAPAPKRKPSRKTT